MRGWFAGAMQVVLALLLCGVAVGQDSSAAAERMWLLQPFVTVPLAPTPQVDGTMREGEWVPTTKLHDLMGLSLDDHNGFAAPEPTHVWLSYSEQGLHVAFRMHMQPGVPPQINKTEGRDVGFEDDAFDMFLIPDDGKGSIIHIGGTAGGVFWDRIIDAGDSGWHWDSGAKYRVEVDTGNNWWTGEWFIPWQTMNRAAPKEGEVWQANFVANRRSPSHRVDTWAYWTKWRDMPGNGRLIFGGKRPSFQMMHLTAEAWGGKGVWPAIEVVNYPVEQPRHMQYSVTLHRRAEGGASFTKELRTRRDKAVGEAATFATFEQDVTASLQGYQVIDQLTKIEHCPPKGWTGPWGGRWKVDEAGDYLLTYHVRDVTDAAAAVDIAGGSIPFRVRVGLQVDVHPFLLTRRSVVVRGDLRAIPQRSAVTQLRASLLSDDGKALAQKTVEADKEPRQEWELSLADVPRREQAYRLRVEALDAGGQVLSDQTVDVRCPPEPDWWVKRDVYGATPEVPSPWTPIEWSDRAASVWGRRISYGDSALPVQIVNQEQSLLARPIDLELRVAGQPVKLSGSMQVREQKPGHVLMQSQRQGGGVRLTASNRLEFDGFSLIDLTIEPIAGPVAIDGLDLVIAVVPQHAEFLTNYRNAPGPGKPVTRYVGKVPAEYASPPMLTTWLGTDHLGLEWSCESSRGWWLSKPDAAIEVKKHDDRVEARFHLIDGPMTLSGPRQIRFGLVPTPVKPIPAYRRNWRIEQAGYPPPLPGITKVKGGTVATEADLANWGKTFEQADVLCMLSSSAWTGPNNRFWHPHCQDEDAAKIVREQTRIAREAGKMMLWNGGWAIAPYSAEWDPWGNEMVALPLTPTFSNQFDHSYASPYVEFMIGSFALNVRDLGIQGIRFDTVFPWGPSENKWLGETWSSDVPAQQGKVYGSQSLFRQRQMLKGIYRAFNPTPGGEPIALIYHPLAGPPIMAVESFVDIHEIGEGAYEHAVTLREGYNQDAARVWFVGRPYGFVSVNNLKGKSLSAVERIGALLVAGAEPRFSERVDSPSYNPPTRQHSPTRRIWQAQRWVDRATAQWHPHWENKAFLTTSAAGEHYASFYLQPGKRLLLIVCNYETQAQEITVELNAKALGFAADAALQAVDAVSGEARPMQGHRLTLQLEPQLFRMIQIMLPGDTP